MFLSLIMLLEMLQGGFASVMREKPPEEVVVFPHPAKSAQTTESAHADSAIATRTRNLLENAARLKKLTLKMSIVGARERMHAQVKIFFIECILVYSKNIAI